MAEHTPPRGQGEVTSGHGSELVTNSLSDLSLQGIVPAVGPPLVVAPSSLLLADLGTTPAALSLLVLSLSLAPFLPLLPGFRSPSSFLSP